MLDLGWQELVMIGLVLILVIGPREMPRVLKAFVKTLGKLRGMARDFQSSMMEVANQDEFKEVKKALDDVRDGNSDALAEFEKVKESVNTSYVPGFSSEVKELQSEAEGLQKDVSELVAGGGKKAVKKKSVKTKAS